MKRCDMWHDRSTGQDALVIGRPGRNDEPCLEAPRYIAVVDTGVHDIGEVEITVCVKHSSDVRYTEDQTKDELRRQGVTELPDNYSFMRCVMMRDIPRQEREQMAAMSELRAL